jgi:hypothetical protein
MSVFLRKATAVEGIRYDGPKMIPEVQQFIAPMSPAYNPNRNTSGQGEQLMVFVRDHASEAQWPSLKIQHKLVVVPIGHYIVKSESGEIAVYAPEEINRDFDVDVDRSMVGDLSAAQVRATAGNGELGHPVFGRGSAIEATHPRAVMAADARAASKAIDEPGDSDK